MLTGTSPHHAEHILAALFSEHYFNLVNAAGVAEAEEKARAVYYRKIKNVTRDGVYRRKLARQFPADHFAFE